MTPTFVYATSIPDAWFQCLYRLINEYEKPNGAARRYKVQTGSDPGLDRVEFDMAVVHISQPGIRPLLPEMPEHLDIPPVADEHYLMDYMRYLISPVRQDNEHYTYGERIQPFWQLLINYYKNHGYDTNRMCLEVAKPEDITRYTSVDGSSPCLRLIDTRIENNTLHWILYFRSWNLWNGFPVNLAGLQLVKEAMAWDIGVEDGEIIAMSKGLNIREYHLDLAKKRLQR